MGARLKTIGSLGLHSVARVGMYRFALKLGAHPVLRIRGESALGPFFLQVQPISAERRPAPRDSTVRMFSRWPVDFDRVSSDWGRNPLTGGRFEGPLRPWWTYGDFDPLVGDIKGIWEMSRFDWTVPLAQRARIGDQQALSRLNGAIESWREGNPPYLGPNWKCGQEASIRVLQLAAVALILEQERKPSIALRALVKTHLRRIAPTVGYALGQNNNHATSEAAGLFVGGSWLLQSGDREARVWVKKGRQMLARTAKALIGPNGTFSQYSVNYHRLMLDSMSFTEVWRQRIGQPRFEASWYRQMATATRWLHSMTDPGSGEAPNIGPNDGARILSMDDSDYRDFRSTVQLACAVFAGTRAYDPTGHWNNALHWLKLKPPVQGYGAPSSLLADDGGFAILRRNGALAVLRYPRYRFRPSEADALHVDLMVDGEPLLIDSGTCSYASSMAEILKFSGTAAHNTVQFGQREQMPRVSRFLLSDWLTTSNQPVIRELEDSTEVSAEYRERKGGRHFRAIRLFADRLEIEDHLDCDGNGACIRWHLPPNNWHGEDLGSQDQGGKIRLRNPKGHTLSVESSLQFQTWELGRSHQSRYYLDKTEVDVVSVRIPKTGFVRSVYQW